MIDAGGCECRRWRRGDAVATSSVVDVLYRSETIEVRRVACADRDHWAITFDNHSIGDGFDRPGFGEEFLRRNGVSTVHILGRGNDWYQYPDSLTAAGIVRQALEGASSCVAYGSSMGGYAALRLADTLGATAVLALSPQYSNDPARVPWERRWEQDSRRIAWRPELEGPLRCACTPLVLYDPCGPDQRHVDLIASEMTVDLVRVPYGGHPVSTFLAETGILPELVRELVQGTSDLSTLRRSVRARRHASPAYLGTLAERQPAHRSRLTIALGRRAVAGSPGNALALTNLATALSRSEKHDEALDLHETAVELSGRDLITWCDTLKPSFVRATSV